MAGKLSALQRDILFALCELNGESGAEVRRYLEDYEGDQIDDGLFYSEMSQLVRGNYVRCRDGKGPANSYRLSERGKRWVRNRQEWLNDHTPPKYEEAPCELEADSNGHRVLRAVEELTGESPTAYPDVRDEVEGDVAYESISTTLSSLRHLDLIHGEESELAPPNCEIVYYGLTEEGEAELRRLDGVVNVEIESPLEFK